MKLNSEITHNIYLIMSLLSLVAAGREDVLGLGNPSKERDTWKGKCEAMEQKFLTFHKDLAEFVE